MEIGWLGLEEFVVVTSLETQPIKISRVSLKLRQLEYVGAFGQQFHCGSAFFIAPRPPTVFDIHVLVRMGHHAHGDACVRGTAEQYIAIEFLRRLGERIACQQRCHNERQRRNRLQKSPQTGG